MKTVTQSPLNFPAMRNADELAAVLYDWHNDARLHAQSADIAYMTSWADRLRATRILVVGCGTGRLGGPLSESGFDVTGIDRDYARIARASARYPRLRTVYADARNFRTRVPFDLAIVPYSTAQLFPAGTALSDLAATLRECTAGRVMVDVSDHFASRSDEDWHVKVTGFCPELGHNVTEWQRIVRDADHCRVLIRFSIEGMRDLDVIEERWQFHPPEVLVRTFTDAGLVLRHVDRGYGVGLSEHRRIYHLDRSDA
jgi:SAM-dependent methyltransferase